MKRSGGPLDRPVGLPGISGPGLRAGLYSDAYFLNASRILEHSALAGERFGGKPLALRGRASGLRTLRPGDAEVEMQFFARRRPAFLASGISFALGLLREGMHRGRGRGKEIPLRVWAVPEGTRTFPLRPVLRVRGRYRDFAHLETPVLGVLARCSRVATNVYESLVASRGKPILFFPARFDLPHCQTFDGYAYGVALGAYERRTGKRVPAHVSTDAQGALWQERGGGTIPHAFILCYLGDTAEALLAFCRHAPVSVLRTALVDTTNDCVGETLRTARVLFGEYVKLLRTGHRGQARRYALYAVRADTSPDLRDRSVKRSSDERRERGVTPILIRNLRQALDQADSGLGLVGRWRRIARDYFRSVRIVATGGFDPAKIRFFETCRAPVDIYGLGSHLLRGEANDYTADVVRVRVGGRFVVAAKVGRGPRPNSDLRPVRPGPARGERSR